MFKRKKKDQSPGARATRAQSNIFVRIIGCGLLVYIMTELIRSEDYSTEDFWKVAIVVVLGLAAAAVIALTVVELVRNIKKGVYSSTYYDVKDEPEEVDNSEEPPK